MSCDLQGYLIRSLAQIDVCAPELVSGKIPTLWEINSYLSCDGNSDVLVYWATRRQALLYLMGCYVGKFDVSQRLADRRLHTETDSKQDSRAEGATGAQSSRGQDGLAQTRHDDESHDSSTSGSERNSDAGHYSDDVSRYDDTGKGTAQSESHGARRGNHFRDYFFDHSSKGQSSSRDRAGMCSLQYSYSWGKGGVTAFTSKSHQKAGSSTYYFDGHRSGSGSSSSATSVSKSDGEWHSFSDSREFSRRFFAAKVDSYESGQSGAQMRAQGHAEGDSESGADGFGYSLENSRATNQSSSNSNSVATGEGSSIRTMEKLGGDSYTDYKLSQIQKHLGDLYENADQTFKMISKERSLVVGMGYTIISKSRVDGFCPMAIWKLPRMEKICTTA